MSINSFRGKYFVFSNFFKRKVIYNGITYDYNECAFQAQKCLDREQQLKFAHLTPSNAKFKGRRVPLRHDWEEVKEQIMYEINKAKYEQNEDLLDTLLGTGDEPLEEGNTWGDKEWGTFHGVGENKLGKILMRLRAEFRQKRDGMVK